MAQTGLVLGIETSCDETAAAVVREGRHVLANVIASQVDLHQTFGGVVPEIASRRHVELILPVVRAALDEAGAGLPDLEAVAVTHGPGLVGALLVGVSTAKALAYALDLPLLAVNHIEGHIYANFLEHADLSPPLVCLVVSGGHTVLFHVPAHGVYRVLGRTRDDAAGEAFDKIARVLGLGYPGGPEIDRSSEGGDPAAVPLPRALAGEGLDFSFSGLKTASIHYLEEQRRLGQPVPLADFAASLQAAIVDVLVVKAVRACQLTGAATLAVSGGVAANRSLRRCLSEAGGREGLRVVWPSPALCSDNAAMIAGAGYFRLRRGETADLSLNAVPGLRLA